MVKGGFTLATYTEHYGLHQWEATDNFLRTDFNTDHQLIDAALAGLEGDKAKIVTGSYMGDGAVTRFISLGFTPKAVLLVCKDGRMNDGNHCYGGLVLSNQPCVHSSQTVMEIGSNGFQVFVSGQNTGYSVNCNLNGSVYYYWALQ